jgi:hypothetical protein
MVAVGKVMRLAVKGGSGVPVGSTVVHLTAIASGRQIHGALLSRSAAVGAVRLATMFVLAPLLFSAERER